jgi:transitional endoplasmic reticulum ATPase
VQEVRVYFKIFSGILQVFRQTAGELGKLNEPRGGNLMECHCKDHLARGGPPVDNCDCAAHDNPTYTFVITRAMEEDPGIGVAFISADFMEKLNLREGDPVELVGHADCVVQARSHPNPWVDTRMISLDHLTMERAGLHLFSQVKLRKASCGESQRITLEVPTGINVTRRQLRTMMEQARGAVVGGRDHLTLINNRGDRIKLRIVETDPEDICSVSRHTRIELVDSSGQEYVSKRDTTFKDVGGLQEAIRKVREIVQLPLRHPEIFNQLGIDPPRGVLLHGPSGTGKTLIARAVAGETGCYFKGISGTEIMDKHYGESEAKLRAAFEDACKNSPAIIFIDEIDALAPRRDTTEGEVEKRVTAQLLALMDGMEDRGSVVVLAATNLPNVLDAALRRPGRFDREILVGVPDRTDRKEILEIHTRDMPLGGAKFDDLAEKTHGFVGADIKALCQEAAFKALRRILPGLEDTEQELSQDFLDEITVEQEDFEQALAEMRPSSGRTYEVDLSGAGWARIAGYSGQIEFLKEVILWPLQNIARLSSLGISHPTGLLITGPSGVGKTLMARSLAKESGFNVIEIRGPELLSKYMGESERNIRELFGQARQMAPTVVILDGLDSMTSSGWSDSRVIDRVVHQLVMEMNALQSDRPVLVVAVSTRAEDLPPALRATGRFGHELRMELPDAQDRSLIFGMYLTGDSFNFQGDFHTAAADTVGFTGSDIKEVCRRVTLQAARRVIEESPLSECQVSVTENDLLKALDRWKLTPRSRQNHPY